MNDTPSVLDQCDKWCPVGSRFSCSPPVLNTDRDFLCLAHDWQAFLGVLIRDNWTFGGSMPGSEIQMRMDCPDIRPGYQFVSVTKHSDNIILTASEEFFKRFVAATSIAKRLNLIAKCDRIALFQAVLYGNPITEYLPPIIARKTELEFVS